MQMIKPGALRLKKTNFKTRTFVLAGVLVVFCSFFNFSCKTVPVSKPVNPLDLLDGENAFYIAVPKNADSELVENILKSNIGNISDKDSKKVAERIDKVYCGLLQRKKTTSYQCAVSCNIPGVAVSSIFSKKNGFEKQVYSTGNSSFDIFNSKDLSISLPDSNTCILGRNVPEMLDTFVYLRDTESDSGNAFLGDFEYHFLDSASDTIRFYANKPQSFLTMLTGVNLDLKLNWVRGEMKQDPKKEDQYILDLDFDFKSEKYIKAGKAVLTLAFGLTDSSDNLENPTELKVSGIKISKKQIYKLLTF